MSKIINLIFQKLKSKFSKKTYNYKLTNLKLVKLCDSIEIERSKLNPLINGLFLDESKGYEQIDLNSNSIYKIESDSIYNKILYPKNNIHINNNTRYDYIQNTFNNLFKKERAKKINKDFNINCIGKLMLYLNKEGNLIISSLDMNNKNTFIIKSNSISNKGFDSFNWDKINPNKIYFSSNNILYESILNLQDIYLYKYYILSKNNFINCFPSPKGDIIILLYKNGIEVYDIFQNLLFSKNYNTFNFINGLYDSKSTLFVTFTECDIIIFNLKNFEFNVFSEFKGKIIKIESNYNNENIYIFTVDDSNKLFMYILTDINIISDVNLNFNSYQNYDIFYRHNHYVLRPEIFGFQYNLYNNNSKILDVNLSPNEDRLCILYEEQFNENEKQNSLYIFQVFKDKRDKTIEKILPLYNFGHIKDNKICNFRFNTEPGNNFMIVRFENDIFIREIINKSNI